VTSTVSRTLIDVPRSMGEGASIGELDLSHRFGHAPPTGLPA
jgi:hypothetical protein